MVKAADHPVEEVPLGGRVSISGLTSTVVVGPGSLRRHLTRDDETLPARSEAMNQLAMTDLMAQRLTDDNTISWRNPAKPAQLQHPG